MFFLIHKPLGLSSFSAIAHLRRKFGIKKIWHTGTLDPLASGLLLVATDNSTKLIPYIDKARKTYVFTVRLDGSTPSCDLDTPVEYLDNNILEKAQKNLSREDVEQVLQTYFSGKVEQMPPIYSALRIQGRRAHELAREGKEVDISKRTIEIYSHKILSFSFPEIAIEMEVSVGTYIRSIARDLGERIGLSGYVTRLHRSKIGHLGEELAQSLEDITQENILPYERIFPHFPVLRPSPEVLEDMRNGLKFPNTLGLQSEKRYLVQDGVKYCSLVEEREGIVRICANTIE